MKITMTRLKEIIQEELEMHSDVDSEPHTCGSDIESDDEGYMIKSELYNIGKYALELHDMINDYDDLPEWMQSKVSQMAGMIGDVKHALEYDQESEELHQDEEVYDSYMGEDGGESRGEDY